MINVEVKHDVDFKKATGITIVLGIAIGATTVITREGIEYSKKKIKEIKDNKNNRK